jgi:predicted GH43/DUF377 family glycosyl hydrolase
LMTPFLPANSPQLIDLEQNPSTFVLDNIQIQIPSYPNATNASIVLWNDGILMSFRDIYDPIITNNNDGSGLASSNIGLIGLDKNLNPIGDPQFLFFEAYSYLPSMPEDPRLIVIGDTLYITYSDNREILPGIEGTRVYVAQIEQINGQYVATNEVCLDKFEHNERFTREKNWVPFSYNNQMLMGYSLLPHRILQPDLSTGVCTTINLTRGQIHWNWGVLRGGTPALPIDNTQYLAFFHSVLNLPSVQSQGRTMPTYFIGAYTFNCNPPFQITQMSSDPIIVKGFYSGQNYEPFWNPVNVIFPCGYIYDDQHIFVSYGRQDHEIFILKIDRVGLMNSLIPIYTRHI